MWRFTRRSHKHTHTHTHPRAHPHVHGGAAANVVCAGLQGKAFGQMLLDLELSGLPDLTALMDTPEGHMCKYSFSFPFSSLHSQRRRLFGFWPLASDQ